MTDWKVGMKVVCVSRFIDAKIYPETSYPKTGKIYTIREIWFDKEEWEACFTFAEIINDKMPLLSNGQIEICEPTFVEFRFRPVVSRPTSIEIFEKMLKTERADA